MKVTLGNGSFSVVVPYDGITHQMFIYMSLSHVAKSL